MKINHRNLDVIGSIAPNMGKKRRNSGLYLDDPDVDIAYYVLENRGALGSQNKQTKKITTCQSGAPLESSQTSVVRPFLQI